MAATWLPSSGPALRGRSADHHAVTTYVAMLRAVNVGGRKLPMAELRALVASLGFGDVRTYVQSGNLVFEGKGKPVDLAVTLADAITADRRFDVPVVVRTAAELAEVVAANPFAAVGVDPDAEPRRFHVTFLGSVPAASAVGDLAAATERYRPDTFRWEGSHVYLDIPGGYGETKLTNALFERKLGVTATTRNWRTVTTLAAMAAS